MDNLLYNKIRSRAARDNISEPMAWHLVMAEEIAAGGLGAFSATNQPRDERGRWTETGGGGMSWTTQKGTTIELKGSRLYGSGPLAGGAEVEQHAPLHSTSAAALKEKGINPAEYIQMGQGERRPVFYVGDRDRLEEAHRRATSHREKIAAEEKAFRESPEGKHTALVAEERNSYSPEHFPGSNGWLKNQAARMALKDFEDAHPDVLQKIEKRKAEKAAKESAFWNSPEGWEKMNL